MRNSQSNKDKTAKCAQGRDNKLINSYRQQRRRQKIFRGGEGNETKDRKIAKKAEK